MWGRIQSGSVAATARRLLSSTVESGGGGGSSGGARTLRRAIGAASVTAALLALGGTAAALAAADDGGDQSAASTQWSGREIPLSALPSRAELLQRLRASGGSTGNSSGGYDDDAEFDVLVIGGGATGVGVALDAQTRGLRTALVERDDFASGACVDARVTGGCV